MQIYAPSAQGTPVLQEAARPAQYSVHVNQRALKSRPQRQTAFDLLSFEMRQGRKRGHARAGPGRKTPIFFCRVRKIRKIKLYTSMTAVLRGAQRAKNEAKRSCVREFFALEEDFFQISPAVRHSVLLKERGRRCSARVHGKLSRAKTQSSTGACGSLVCP